ncbi:ribose-5-phosphate isomerase [Spirochaetia bacterium]|nr:ribose-5-phosphate isomerase [Spirochaetia bacterium]
MKIAIGCDPNAAALKETIKKLVESLGHQVTDYGSDDAIYANVAIALAADVAAGKHDRGILICGTGIGMSIAANKVKGAYAALITDIYQAQRASLSNNANIITLGAFVTGVELAKALVKEYLSLSFDPASSSAPKVNRITKYDKEGV